MADSTLYTIGTALHHARDHGSPVQLLVGGMWLNGVVVAIDGFGVVLSSHDDEHAVVRLEAVAAVKVAGAAPRREPISATAQPMPRPRPASAFD